LLTSFPTPTTPPGGRAERGDRRADTPTLHCMSAADMAASGHIERLFAGAGISFDPATLTIRLAKK